MMIVMCCSLLFFFKQKTAYEMRISDWSSDVCSSDLVEVVRVAGIVTPDVQDDGVARHHGLGVPHERLEQAEFRRCQLDLALCAPHGEIGRASCRERVCKYV